MIENNPQLKAIAAIFAEVFEEMDDEIIVALLYFLASYDIFFYETAESDEPITYEATHNTAAYTVAEASRKNVVEVGHIHDKKVGGNFAEPPLDEERLEVLRQQLLSHPRIDRME